MKQCDWCKLLIDKPGKIAYNKEEAAGFAELAFGLLF